MVWDGCMRVKEKGGQQDNVKNVEEEELGKEWMKEVEKAVEVKEEWGSVGEREW